MEKAKLIRLTGYLLYLVFFISLFFSFRAISSFALGLLLIWSLIFSKTEWKRNSAGIYLFACIAYFVPGLVASLFSNHEHKGNHILLQSGLLLTGLSIYLSIFSRKLNQDIIFLLLGVTLCIVLLYSLTTDLIEFSRTKEKAVFFYHALVNPAKQHAVYFSLYVFAVLVWLIESVKRKSFVVNKGVYFGGIIFFSTALFFLSSKLVLGFYLLYLLYQLILSWVSGKNLKYSLALLVILLIAGSLTVFTKNPVGDRFRELIKGDMAIVSHRKNDPGTYFNGWQFRLLQWRLVPEILNEKKLWMSGSGPGGAQELLDNKYRERNMYLGDGTGTDRGYLGYNTHNQFLEALLQNGIIGSFVFLVIAVLLLKMGWDKRKTGFGLFFILLFIYSLMESVFETQHGIILYCFLPLFLYSKEETF